MNNDREAFEAKFPFSRFITWDEVNQCYVAASIGYIKRADKQTDMLTAWQAAKEDSQEEIDLVRQCNKYLNNEKELLGLLNNALETELEAIKADRSWISLEEFSRKPNEGWCWIVCKGRVVSAYHDHEGVFRFSNYSKNYYITESISHAMPWYYPEPPKIED